MSVLQRFEKRLEGLVEGAFAKVFKGVVHPVEILNAMQREAEAHKAILVGGRTLVPNRYVIDLSPYDHSRLAPYAAALARYWPTSSGSGATSGRITARGQNSLWRLTAASNRTLNGTESRRTATRS